MSDFITKLKKLTRSALNKTTEHDVKLIFDSTYVSDWKLEMEDRAKDGYNHFCVWKFHASEYVFFMDDDQYDIGKNDPEAVINRSYTAGQFFNSKAFKEWILDLFPDCKLYYDSVDYENYSIRLSW